MSARPLFDAAIDAPPASIGKYRIDGVLGEGAMGIVYKALDPQIQRPVAIKTIRRPLLGAGARDLAALERFRTEAQAAGRLSHPNIVAVYELGGDAQADGLYLVMEYVHGTPLHELLQRRPRLPWPDVMSLMLQLLDALRAAHDQGVWHRDIKPANLLVTPDGRLKVTDFGIARLESSAPTLAATTMGSPGYMAPERYGDAAPDARVDLFSCGVLLYELLTGQAPFVGAVDAVMYQVLHRDPPAPSTLPIACRPPARYDAIVAKALAKRPDDRFASAQEMLDALIEATPGPVRPTLSTQTVALVRVPPSPGAGQAADIADTAGAPRVSPPSTAERPPAAMRTGPGLTADLQGMAHWLTSRIGPMAPLLVSQAAARHAGDLAAVARQLAQDALDGTDRADFLAEVAARWGLVLPSEPVRASAAPASDATVPLSAQEIERVRQALACKVGPIANLLVARAAAASNSNADFQRRLQAQAAGLLEEA